MKLIAKTLTALVALAAFLLTPASAQAQDGISQMLNRLNGMSAVEVNALMNRGHWLDQFTPYWLKRAPNGNVLAQFGIGNGLMKALGSRDLRTILDPRSLEAIRIRLAQAHILGQLAAGQAAQNRVYNQVQRHDYLMMADRARIDAMRRLYEAVARTGLAPNVGTSGG